MNYNRMVSIINSFKFDKSQFVVVAGSAMCMYGMRDTTDIDLFVSPILWEKLALSDLWRYRYYPPPQNTHKLKQRPVDTFLDIGCGTFRPTFDEVLEKSVDIDGINVMSINHLISSKENYKRIKDTADLILIQLLAR